MKRDDDTCPRCGHTWGWHNPKSGCYMQLRFKGYDAVNDLFCKCKRKGPDDD